MREVCFDKDLGIEAYRLCGYERGFPNHFHEHYVIGLIEQGKRTLVVDQVEYVVDEGDLLTFNPYDSHACTQREEVNLSYRGFNIETPILAGFALEVFGVKSAPLFRSPVLRKDDVAEGFLAAHKSLMENRSSLEKEELILLFMQQLLQEHCVAESEQLIPEMTQEPLEWVCEFIESHFADKITLDTLAGIAGMNKYTLVRAFTQSKGITPYRYLETTRINKAQRFLEQGRSVSDVAQLTGFSDQSHFSNFFCRFIGLPPGQYQSMFIDEDHRRGQTELL